MSMNDHTTCIDYRSVSIKIKVERKRSGLYGHADLFAGDTFKGRIAIGAMRCDPDDLSARLRIISKSKVDVWSLASGTTTTPPQCSSRAPPEPRRAAPGQRPSKRLVGMVTQTDLVAALYGTNLGRIAAVGASSSNNSPGIASAGAGLLKRYPCI